MIDGVRVKELKRHVDDRGYVMEILRDDEDMFIRFGQIYVSTCYPGVVKAWHAHERQTDNFCVVKGHAKIGLYDGRPDSPTCGQSGTFILGESNPILLQIPPLVWHGQMAIGLEVCYLLNIPTQHYDCDHPDELRADAFDSRFGYEWGTKSR